MSQVSSPRSRRPVMLLAAGLVFVAVVVGVGWWLDDPPLYDRVEDGLWMGGRVDSPPWRTRAVLNLCEVANTYTCEVQEHHPIRDAAPAPSLAWLREQVEWIAEQRRAGRRVYVHCQNGVSRSGLVVIAYLMSEHGWTVDEALAFVRSKRSGVRPNPAFMTLLADWERALRGEPPAPTE